LLLTPAPGPWTHVLPYPYVAGSLRLCLKPSQESETTTPDKSRLTFTYINIFVYIRTQAASLSYTRKNSHCANQASLVIVLGCVWLRQNLNTTTAVIMEGGSTRQRDRLIHKVQSQQFNQAWIITITTM
jgi:hypothetical protein